MRTPSAAAWPIHASIVRRVLELTLAAAILAVAGLGVARAAELRAVEQHDGYDRIVIPFKEESGGRPAVPLLRRGNGAYRLGLPTPLASIAGTPRGIASFQAARNADGAIGTIDLVPAPGVYLRYRTVDEGFALDVVHGLPAPSQSVEPPPARVATGPLPPKAAHAGVLFSAPRLAAWRLGNELILVMPVQADLDPTMIPPARVSAVTAGEQGQHRLVRLRLRPDTRVEIAREGERGWRLGFSTDTAVAPARSRFAAAGRSVVVDADAGTLDVATLSLPELGAVAVVLANEDWAMAPARSPYLDVLAALVGGVVVPRTDALAIERRADGIAINGVSH